MSEFRVELNDPAYPPGTALTVAGISHQFVNGETVVIDASMVNEDVIPDLELALHALTGATVAPVGGSSEAPPVTITPVDLEQAAVELHTQIIEGGENQ